MPYAINNNFYRKDEKIVLQKSKIFTYGFQFKGDHQKRITGIHSIGWEKVNQISYDWDGLERKEQDVIVFQYTLKGLGEIKIKNTTYSLKPGKAFFVKVPSDHRYYLPSDSSNWEFLHITLIGQEAQRVHDLITEKVGSILNLNISDKPITHIFKLLKNISNNQINDAYDSSSFAFAFLMALEQYITSPQRIQRHPDSIVKAIDFIKNNYDLPITLDEIVSSSGLSKYYFTRLFHKSVGLTPISYLSETRINKAIKLLKNDSLTLEDIALKVGFSNGNYFCKVFRASIGLPPGEYRRSKAYMPVDHLIRDY